MSTDRVSRSPGFNRSRAERSLAGRIGAHASWANTEDRTARTAPGRSKFDQRFERQVDPDGVLPENVRAERAASAKSAYFAQLALKSAAARRSRKSSR